MQDAWLRYSAAQPSDLRSPQAYLTTIVTRLCLDRLKSARAAREEYIGPWLPEPMLTDDRRRAGTIAGARRVGHARLHGAARDALAGGARRLPAARGLRPRLRRDRGDARHDAGELPPAVPPREAAHRRPAPALSRHRRGEAAAGRPLRQRAARRRRRRADQRARRGRRLLERRRRQGAAPRAVRSSAAITWCRCWSASGARRPRSASRSRTSRSTSSR